MEMRDERKRSRGTEMLDKKKGQPEGNQERGKK